MKSTDIRRLFLDYFQRHGHAVVPSSPLVPANDPTLLFTNAGMVQFKDVFLGAEKRPYVRAASSQRCVRAGGKHNDLENVGYTGRHHTFFEMLGNFSFGDYFKREAIGFAWEFLTKDLKLSKEKLWVTVYKDDDEAADIWLKQIGVDPKRFTRLGEASNFWQMGDTGPCGPCSEVFYDHGAHVPGGPPGSPDEDGDRYVEIWNLVFMQYNRDAKGKLTPLPKPSVDTGMGLERISAVIQGVHSNYEIDLFRALIHAAADAIGTDDRKSHSLNVVADHIRSAAFLITDGVLPSNEGRGYVLRRIIRRAIRHGNKLGAREAFFYKLVAPLCQQMGDAYPELNRERAHVERVLKQEEERFNETLEQGLQILESELSVESRFARYAESRSLGLKHLERAVPKAGSAELLFTSRSGDKTFRQYWKMISVPADAEVHDFVESEFNRELSQLTGKARGSEFISLQLVFLAASEVYKEVNKALSVINMPISDKFEIKCDVLDPNQLPLSGSVAFKLYDTYGFPVDLTRDVALERNLKIDMAGFEREMEAQRERARAASSFKTAEIGAVDVAQPTEFSGYERLADEGRVLDLTGGAALTKTDVLKPGEAGNVVLDHTPFYAESGGQVGDRGVLRAGATVFRVEDTQKVGQVFVHKGRVESGVLRVGDRVTAEVDMAMRRATMLNHSATHLMHKALRDVLGPHVQQKGSLVDERRTRFDFSHFEPLTPVQIAEVERRVNAQILLNEDTRARVMGMDAARAEGAMALFGEKYGAEVRVLNIGDSIELCGGTHVRRTGDIGLFKIVSESGVAAGVRRIEAVTGENALVYVRESELRLQTIADLVRANRDEAARKVEQLLARTRQLEKEIEQLRGKLASGGTTDIMSQVREVKGIKVLAARMDGVDAKGLREAMDRLKDKLASAAIVLAAVADNKVTLIAGVTKDLVSRIHAGELVNQVAARVGGKGGGRPDMAQAGGNDPAGLDGALADVPGWVEQWLK